MLQRSRSALRRNRHRHGFTLMEFLVVVAVIVILLAIVLPGIHQARESARKTQCQNNLKLIGLAIHNYHDAYYLFPIGHQYMGTFDGDIDSDRGGSGFSWGWSLLPFTDAGGLFNQFNPEQQVAESRFETSPGSGIYNADLCRKVLHYYRCPSDRMPTNRTDGAIIGSATSSYQGNSSSYNGYQVTWDKNYKEMMYRRNGIFGRTNAGGARNMRDILDGSSNTIAVAETRWDMQKNGTNRSRWYGAQEKNGLTGAQGATNALCVQGEWPLNWTEAQGNPQPNRTAGSAHKGGANFLFCDGSVKFISDQIEHTATPWINVCNRFDRPNDWKGYGLYQRLFSRNDQDPVNTW